MSAIGLLADAAGRERYRLCPQMREYDALPNVIAPYVTFRSPARHSSGIVNTDADGFRLSRWSGRVIDSRTWWDHPSRALVIGGSFVFGVGAESDGSTLASELGIQGRTPFLNAGIRAANSTQEAIASIPFVHAASAVVVCSGVNNVAAALQSTGRNELFGPLFNEQQFETLERYPLSDVAATASASLARVSLQHPLRRIVARVRGRRAPAPMPDGGSSLTDDEATAAAERATERQVRDLRFIASAARRGTRVVFGAQPFADTCAKTLTREERTLFETSDQLQGSRWAWLRTQLARLWPSCVERLACACQEMGVGFVDLNAAGLHDWCFVDRVHMRQVGYAQVARRIIEVLGCDT